MNDNQTIVYLSELSGVSGIFSLQQTVGSWKLERSFFGVTNLLLATMTQIMAE